MMRTTYTSAALLACLAAATPAAAQYSVTILHHGDGESALSRAGEFATLLNQSRDFYTGLGHGVVSVYAGDSIIPGPEFQASLDSGDPGSRTFFDAIALDLMGYDAVAVGNHEFDAGPAVFAEFLQATSVPFVSANLDFSGEASLAGLVGTDLFKSTTVNVPVTTPGGVVNKTIGIVGATTPNLPFVTSVGGVVVNDVLTSVNAEVAALKGAGVDHIVMIDQLQGIGVDLDLVNAGLSTDIDLIVSGGGEEISADLGAASPADRLSTT